MTRGVRRSGGRVLVWGEVLLLDRLRALAATENEAELRWALGEWINEILEGSK